jgi:hypothetical protein
MRRGSVVVGILLLAGLVVGIAYWRLTTNPPPVDDGVAAVSPSAKPATPPPNRAESEAEKTRRLVLGTWQDHYKGKRTMILNDDGTGTMVCELSGIQATLFASKLRFDMHWSLEGKILKKRTVSGEPRDKVNLILNMMGNVAEDTIQELTDERLLLLDKDGKTQYDWKRIKPE